LEHRFTGFAIARLQCVHNARPLVRRDYDSVHQNINRLAEVDIQQRLRRGELKNLPILEEPAKTFFAQIK
jgi:hypothetical protein